MVELADLPGVGEKTAEKLKDAGFADMMRLATATPKELSVKAEIGEGVADSLTQLVKKEGDTVSNPHIFSQNCISTKDP